MIIEDKSGSVLSNGNGHPVRKVVVLGGGSAGFLVALALAKRLPQLETVVVRSTQMGVIGVGEGTIATIARYLHDYLEIDQKQFHCAVHPSIKLGIQFKWGTKTPFHYSFAPQFTAPIPRDLELTFPRGYYCATDASFADVISALMIGGKVALCNEWGEPRIPKAFAYHLENKRFVDFLEDFANECKIQKIDAVVSDVKLNDNGVSALLLENGDLVSADLFVDCSGFRSELLGCALEEPFVPYNDSLYCDRAIVGGWSRTNERYNAFTTAEAMDAGWAWQIEHDDIINRGYVYSSSFISDDQAEREFCNKNSKIESTRMLKFRSGVYRRAWVKNVVAIGNAYGFVEPLEATAIGMICTAADNLVKILDSGSQYVSDIQRKVFNDIQDANWEQIRDFLALHYKPNTNIQTPFWQACQNDIPLGNAQDIVDYYRLVGPDFQALEPRLKRDIFGAEGYLAMLVGQGVPYRRSIHLGEKEQEAWQQLKRQMRQRADQGIEMTEYLSLLRCGAAELRS